MAQISMNNNYTGAIKTTARILDAWLPWKIKYDRTPGLSVGIVHRGKLVYKNGFGFADLELQKPATSKTCYRIASISKTFTAIAIMQLVERKKLSLDDKAIQYLPWFKTKNKKIDSSIITIRDLLSHTAGVFRDGITPHWTTDAFPDSATLKKSILPDSLTFESSTQFKYSNFGFALLGKIIEKVSGVPYEHYVTDHILTELNMRHTAPDFTETARQKLSNGYGRVIPDSERDCFEHRKTNAYAPATGFLSNVHDLARYLGSLSLTRHDNHILTRESKKELFREHMKTGREEKSYCLGFDSEPIENNKIVGHGGGFAGFITRISLDLENDIGVIILTNSSEGSSVSITKGIFKTIYAMTEKSDRAPAQKPNMASFYRCEGLYRSREGDELVVAVGSHIISFDPQTSDPMKNATTLQPHKKNCFILHPASRYNSPGEYAQFIGSAKSKKMHTLKWGSQLLERVA